MPFVEIDVMADSQGFDEVLALGYRRVPLTVADGRAVAGFDPDALDVLTRAVRGKE